MTKQSFELLSSYRLLRCARNDRTGILQGYLSIRKWTAKVGIFGGPGTDNKNYLSIPNYLGYVVLKGSVLDTPSAVKVNDPS